MSRRQGPRERSLRYVLALALVGMIPLAIWTGGCESGPVVEPPSDSGPTDVATDGGDAASDAAKPTDAGDDALPPQCCSPDSPKQQCSADGSSLQSCIWFYAAPFECKDHPEYGPGTGYGYVWMVSRCQNGCAISTVDGGTAPRCQ